MPKFLPLRLWKYVCSCSLGVAKKSYKDNERQVIIFYYFIIIFYTILLILRFLIYFKNYYGIKIEN